MFGFFKKLMGITPEENVDFKALKKQGAIIIDVRTINEYRSGHIKGAKNIPVQVLNQKLAQVKKYKKPIITYCRSGQRSSLAVRILRNNGITSYNGGSYESLKSKLK